MDFPVLPADIKKLNRQLEAHFGIDTESMLPMWRISWSNDQYERRMTDRTNSGVLLLMPEIRELPKYQWVRDRWILENLVLVPEVSRAELAGATKSYECMWKFEDRNGEAVAPFFDACKFIIDVVNAVKGKETLGAKYTDPDAENPIERMHERVLKLENELFGDESGLEGKTHLTKEAIVVPPSYETTQKVN